MKLLNTTVGIPKKALIVISLGLMFGLFSFGCNSQPETPDMVKVGVLNVSPVLEASVNAFKDEMTQLGYVENETITYIDYGPEALITADELSQTAEKIVSEAPQLILTIGTEPSKAMQKATAETQTPIVFTVVADPIGASLVENLQKPNTNLTGVYLGPKESRRFEWLKTLLPDVKRVYVPYNPEFTSARLTLPVIVETAAGLGVELEIEEMRTEDELKAAIESIPDDVEAIFILPDSFTLALFDAWFAESSKIGIPVFTPTTTHVEEGALMSYGPTYPAMGQQAALVADRILHGANPRDLPIEVAEFSLALNLKTAEAVGLEISDDVLELANIIIR